MRSHSTFLSYKRHQCTKSVANGGFSYYTGWSQWSVRLRERRVAEKEIEGDSVFRENGPTMDDIVTNRLRMTLGKELDPRHSPNHGSFYLRMGAVGMAYIKIIWNSNHVN